MEKTVGKFTLHYEFNPNRKNAHYTFDGVRYMNGGDFAECADKFVRGYKPVKDGNTPYDKDSDIPDLLISVKSARCGLTDAKLADNLEEFKAIYFERVHSSYFDWVIVENQDVTIYTMNKHEFKEFVDKFGKWEKYSKKVRFGTNTKELKNWLAGRVA